MYAVEVNLLKDRPGYRQETTTDPSLFSSLGQGPLFLGSVAGGGFLSLALATFLILSLLNQRLVTREQELDQQLSAIAPEIGQVESLQAQEKQVTAETNALASVFNQVKPWSAMLQDMRDRVPTGLQITSIQQAAPTPSANPTPGASPAPPPPSPAPTSAAGTPAPAPAAGLTLTGKALSFSAINDFVLALENSAFLKGEETRLISSQLQEAERGATPLAEYQIQSDLNDVPASELLQELNRKGATGLVTRIQTLKEKGVIKP